MKLFLALVFIFFVAISFGQEYYKLDSKTSLRENPGKLKNSQVIQKGELLELLSYEADYLKVKNEKYEGYIWIEKQPPFRSEKAKNKIAQLVFINSNKEILENRKIALVPLKNDNTILIPSNREEDFELFNQYLMENGFSIDTNFAETDSVLTAFRMVKYKNKEKLAYRLLVFRNKQEIKIKMEYVKAGVLKSQKDLKVNKWSFKAEIKYTKNLIFWDFAPVLESNKHDHRYSYEPISSEESYSLLISNE